MSRPSTSRGGGGGPTTKKVTTWTNADGEEQCPICKTLRYMNRNMKFLINPECYHPLCNNCVDRLFGSGPAACPYSDCQKTLRKKAFREPMFSDLDVEREVDIRKRVAAVFNKGEDDFESLKDYNDYLDMVETLTMDLVYGTPAERDAADQRLLAWTYEHKNEIERNRRDGEKAREQTLRQLEAEKKSAAKRRLEAARQVDEDRLRKAREREATLDRVASAPAGTADKILDKGRVSLKQRGRHHLEAAAASEAAAVRAALAASGGDLTIKGLKKKPLASAASAAAEDTGPYRPFGSLDLRPSRYVLHDRYENEHLENLRRDPQLVAGGFNVQEYYSRALFEAFAGLAVFVSDEKETGRAGLDFKGVATKEAAMAAATNDNERSPGTDRRKMKNASVVLKTDPSQTRRAGGVSPPIKSEDGDVQMRDDVKPKSHSPSPLVKMEVDSG